MSLIERIRTDSIAARKAGNKLEGALLSTLFAEAARVGKDAGNRASTDDEVVKTIRKFQKNCEETAALVTGESKAKCAAELQILARYLPQMMSADELKAAIDEIVSSLPEKSPKAMGQVMAALKERHAGRYDGKDASAAVKAALAG